MQRGMSWDLRQFKKEAEGTEEPGGQDLQGPAQAHSEWAVFLGSPVRAQGLSHGASPTLQPRWSYFDVNSQGTSEARGGRSCPRVT